LSIMALMRAPRHVGNQEQALRGAVALQSWREPTGTVEWGLSDSVAMLFLGASAVLTAPRDIFPRINIPVVTVIWQYTGLTPDLEQRVTTYSEYSISSNVNNIRNIESQTLTSTSRPPARMLTVVGRGTGHPGFAAIAQKRLRTVHDSRLRKAGSGERLGNALPLEMGGSRPRFGTQRVASMYCAGLTYFSAFYHVGAVSYIFISSFSFGKSAEGSRDDRPESSYCYLLWWLRERRALATMVDLVGRWSECAPTLIHARLLEPQHRPGLP
jgi:hypothetical protein